MAEMTENQERLPNEKELREHQEAIQDIIDIFSDTQDLVSGSSQNAPSDRRTQIIPSDTSSSRHAHVPKRTSFPSSAEAPNSYSSIQRKRSAEAAELACEPATFPTKSGKHTEEPSGSYRIMTPQEDCLIWKRYQAHQKEARNRGLNKKASSGITSQIAKELQTNRQTITARLNVLRSKHATNEQSEQSEHEDQNSDVHSLQCDILPKHLLQEDAKSRMTEGEACWSGDDYWTDAFPGFCYTQHHYKTPPPKEFNHSSSSAAASSSASTPSATGSTSRKVEAPLAPTPHIARKSTFSPQDDVILWNAYIRNGCQVLPEAQCTGLMKRLKRSNTSCLEYRMRRLVAEDQGVSMDDIQKCAFTPTDDAHILRHYHANNALSVPKQRTEETLCRDLSQQVHHESVRVLYRLHYLLNHYEAAAEPKVHCAPKAKNVNNDSEAEFEGDNESEAASKDEDSDYKHAAKGRATRETSYCTRHNKKRFYTEEEDMVIWTAYLSAASDIERNNALRKAGLELNRSWKGVQHRLQRLLNDQQKAELDCAASGVYSSEDEMSVQEQEVHSAQPRDSAHSTRPVDNVPLYIGSSDESSYAERDCSSDEESDDESESESNTDLGSSDESSGDADRSYSSTADGGSSSENGGTRSNHERHADDHSSSDTSSTSRVSDLAESTSVFLTRLRSTGMDFIAPRSIHYQVLAVILACLQQLHASSNAPLPLYNDVIRSVLHRITQLSNSVPQLKRITDSQLRGVLVLLQRADCVRIHGGPHMNLPITVCLVDQISTFPDLRRRHDRFLETLMTEQGEVKVEQLLWPRDAREQMYLKKKVELVTVF